MEQAQRKQDNVGDAPQTQILQDRLKNLGEKAAEMNDSQKDNSEERA